MTDVLEAMTRWKDDIYDYEHLLASSIQVQQREDLVIIANYHCAKHAADDDVNPLQINPTPKYEAKNWGRVWHRFYDDHAGESLLEVVAGQRCSMHYHEHRWNVFICIDATIEVTESFDVGLDDDPFDYEPKKSMLFKGGICVVPFRTWHFFRVLRPGRIIEIYYTTDDTPVLMDDIVRFDVGRAYEV